MSTKTEKKKASPKLKNLKSDEVSGIKPGSAIKAMKSFIPTETNSIRISNAALLHAISDTENLIKMIAINCLILLEHTKKKTVTKKVLEYAAKTMQNSGAYACVLREMARPIKDSQDDRNVIANASVQRVFGTEIKLGKNYYRISKSVCNTLSQVAELNLKTLGQNSFLFAKTGGRHTIKERDVLATIKIRC